MELERLAEELRLAIQRLRKIAEVLNASRWNEDWKRYSTTESSVTEAIAKRYEVKEMVAVYVGDHHSAELIDRQHRAQPAKCARTRLDLHSRGTLAQEVA